MKQFAKNVRHEVPGPETPVIDPTLVAADRRWLIPAYREAVWSLLALNNNPSAANESIRWDKFPDGLREPMRHAGWVLINSRLPDADLAKLGPATRSRLGVSRTTRTVIGWGEFARWLDAHGVAKLSAVTRDDFTLFSLDLAKKGLSRNTVIQYMVGLVRLHLFGVHHLPARDRLPVPPWLTEGMDDYLPAAAAGGENVTEPISPDTLGPLLIWSLRMVEDLSADILAARAERTRLLQTLEGSDRASGRGGLERYLRELMEARQPVPSHRIPGNKIVPATKFLAAKTNTPLPLAYSVLRQPRWRDYAKEHPGPAALDVHVQGRIGGAPWRDCIDYANVPNLTKHLVTACFVVIAYLTGMRPGEVLGLEYGCCPEPDAAVDAAKRHVIHARHFKTARDEHGNHLSAGEFRDAPWVAVPQVVRAIRVLEAIVGPGQLLFDAAVTNDDRHSPMRNGRAMATATVANRIEDTVRWFNVLAHSLGRDAETIPPDPDGRVGLNRFRRTLAWHIARRPGGLVALALQYGHMRTIVSEGYASRSRGGIHQLLAVETARTVAEHLSDVHEAIQDGQGVSGPAARRLIYSAAHQAERFDGIVLTLRQARALLADPSLHVFDHPDAYVTCNYDPSKALCHRERDPDLTTPSLDRCQDNCANIARTDTHATSMDRTADDLLAQARSGLLPAPIAERLTSRAHELQQRAQRHRDDRITAERANSGSTA